MTAGGSNGEAANGADVVFELRNGAGVDRPMAGIVGAGGDFIGQNLAILCYEEFQCENTDKIEVIGQAFYGFFGGGLNVIRQGAGNEGAS